MDDTHLLTKKVLIIEDELDISELYERALSKDGFKVTRANDGKDAFIEAKKNIYDVILLDLMMPNLTGIEILKQLKKPEAKIKAKIIIITNLEQTESDRQKIIDLADGYLVKASVTPNEVAEYVKSIQST